MFLLLFTLAGGQAEASSPDLRVLIFPHLLKYVAPQGRETLVTGVTLKTEGICTARNRSGQVVQQAAELRFNWDGVTEPLAVDCTKDAQVVREAGLPSYTYSGSFTIQRGRETKAQIQVINWVTLENYLAGVVPAEMPQAWPLETLKAQAVAARTYALWELRKARRERPMGSALDTGYDIDDTIQYQAYTGSTEAPLPQTVQALQETRGKFITTGNGSPIRAYFHADSGGHTEDAANAILEVPAPYCLGKAEVYDPAGAPAPWVKKIALAEATQKLQAAGLITGTLTTAEVEEATRLPSGRAKNVVLTADSAKTVSALDVRFALGVKSTMFKVHVEDGSLIFEGRGSGHGVGMSQWGAKLLVDQLHWDYEKILLFYYTGVTLR
jgi:stage II sporulation protein D